MFVFTAISAVGTVIPSHLHRRIVISFFSSDSSLAMDPHPSPYSYPQFHRLRRTLSLSLSLMWISIDFIFYKYFWFLRKFNEFLEKKIICLLNSLIMCEENKILNRVLRVLSNWISLWRFWVFFFSFPLLIGTMYPKREKRDFFSGHF